MGRPASQPLSSPKAMPCPHLRADGPDDRYPRAQSGTPWRQLPTEYGKRSSVYRRYARWRDQGVWPRRMAYLQADPELSPYGWTARSCAHTSARRARPSTKAFGRSRGGFNPQIHSLTDRRGRHLRLYVTGGQRHDSTQSRLVET